MARFTYQARDGSGALGAGAISAPSIEEASRMLRAEGKFIIKLAPASDAAPGEEAVGGLTVAQHAKRVKRQDVIVFCNQMAVMIDTGVPMSEALDCATEQAANPHFKAVLRDVTSHVQGGGEFSVALRKFPNVFPSVMTSLIRASEVSGTMGPMLDRITRYLTKEEATRKKVKGALSYPLFMLLMAIAVTVFLLAFVLPRFAAIYATRDANLPGPTRLLMGLSNLITTYWYFWLAAAVVLIGGWLLMLRTPSGRRFADWLKLKLPIISSLYSQLYVARACSTMGTMISAGVSMLDMISIVRQVTANAFYEDLWDEVDERLRQGAQLSEPLFASNLIPRSVAQMIHSGERSGRLAQTMNRIAEYTEEEFDTAVKTTTQFIEPAMVMVMGGIIGFVAIALLLPIFSVGTVVASG